MTKLSGRLTKEKRTRRRRKKGYIEIIKELKIKDEFDINPVNIKKNDMLFRQFKEKHKNVRPENRADLCTIRIRI